MHQKLRILTFFDPACGCGNFLVITYRELRLLELAVLSASHKSGQQVLDVQQLIKVDVDQFYGIKIEEFPAQIAQVALWLTDRQMNMKISEEFGAYFTRIPLKATPHIVHGNALQLNWAAGGRLYQYSEIKCAFVSTNNITQGEPHAVKAANINPYLADALNLVMLPCSTSFYNVSPMINGSKPTDGGNLILSADERAELLIKEPVVEHWIKLFAMGMSLSTV